MPRPEMVHRCLMVMHQDPCILLQKRNLSQCLQAFSLHPFIQHRIPDAEVADKALIPIQCDYGCVR